MSLNPFSAGRSPRGGGRRNRKLRAAARRPDEGGHRTAGLWFELLEDRRLLSVTLNWPAPGGALTLTESSSGATPAITISETSSSSNLLKIDLGSGVSFSSTSTTGVTGLTYQNAGSPATSQYATLDASVANNISSLAATLPGDGLTLGPIYDAKGGLDGISASAATIAVAAVSTTSVNGNVALSATGDLTVNTGATLQTGTGTITLAADVKSDGTGDDGAGTLSIGAGATVTSANPSASAITLRGAAVTMATSFSSTGSATLTGLSSPYGVALDQSGNLYVANYGNNTVSKFAPGSTTPTATLTGLSSPTALAFDTSGNLYVTNDVASGTVSKFAPGSTTPTATLTGLTKPWTLAFDPGGNLYVTNYINGTSDKVIKFAAGSTTPGATLTGLSFPSAVACDQSGNVYVANYAGGSGTTVSEFAPGSTTASTTLTGLSGPRALAFDSSGNLYVANYGNGGGGTTVSEIASGATAATATLTGLSNPWAMTFDQSGNLYVANCVSSGTLSRFAPGTTTASTALTGLAYPDAVVSGQGGYVYVASRTGNTVAELGSAVAITSNITASAGGVAIRSSLPTRPMSLGGTGNAPSGVDLTSAELAQISTAATGTVTIGDSSQTGNITFTTATVATTPGASTVVLESTTGPGAIILDDAGGAGTALNGNGGAISLTAGTGGIVSLSANDSAAEVATAGAAVTMNTTGPIGTSTNRIQFADNGNTAEQNVVIGVTSQPSSVFLDGPGTLTLGGASGSTIATAINVTTATKLVAAGAGTCTLNLGGTGGLTQIGSGTVILSGNSSYGTNTMVSAGTLRIAAAGALPTGTSVAVSGTGVVQLQSNLGKAIVLSGLTFGSGGGGSVAASPNLTAAGAAGPLKQLVPVADGDSSIFSTQKLGQSPLGVATAAVPAARVETETPSSAATSLSRIGPPVAKLTPSIAFRVVAPAPVDQAEIARSHDALLQPLNLAEALRQSAALAILDKMDVRKQPAQKIEGPTQAIDQVMAKYVRQ